MNDTNQPEPGPLETATTGELLAEVVRRFRYAVFFAVAEAKGDADAVEPYMYRKGGLVPAAGLLRLVDEALVREAFGDDGDGGE
jgi:hypothetical protein